MKVHWTMKPHDLVGNALGYNVHNSNMLKYAAKYLDIDESAEIALTITPADQFVPVPGKFNILFTMWEFLDLPQSYITGINKADLIIVPCRFCKDVFSRYTKKPIEVCWEGVEPSLFKYHERKINSPFRFLWVGAPNPRKGYPLVLEVLKVFQNHPEIEIYIKTTAPQLDWKKTFSNIWKKRKHIFDGEFRGRVWHFLQSIPRPGMHKMLFRTGKHKNIIWDSRKLPLEDLISLYHSAHCFILPSFGEGWGLTLCEAMATGAPCVASAHTGSADFFDEQVGYPISFEIKEQEMRNYDVIARGYVPDTHDFLRKMIQVVKNYPEALRRGKRASERIHSTFTWDKSAKRLAEIIRKYAPVEVLA